MDPYLILDVPEGSDDATIRRAYLAAVKDNPPDHNPDRFREINEAWDRTKDAKSRAEFELFNAEPGISSPFEALVNAHRYSRNTRRTPPSFSALKEFLQQCSKTKK